MRSFIRKLSAFTALFFVLALPSGHTDIPPSSGGGGGGGGAGTAAPTEFEATLSGTEEVPVVTTTATGRSRVEVDPTGTVIRYRLGAKDITGVTAAHIHAGAPGEAGPVIFNLLPSGALSSCPVSGELRAGDLQPNAERGISTFSDAVNAIQSGGTYVNVHTSAHPDGEVRGQLLAGDGVDDGDGC